MQVIRERVPLEHRADGEVRRVPIHPELVEILRAHIDEYGPADPDGRLFVGAHDGPVTDRTYLRRSTDPVLSLHRSRSGLTAVDCPLRPPPAAVSTWLRTTGDAALVARWAGHSVAVLLKVYAKTADGAEQESLDRIWSATRRSPDKPPSGTNRERAAVCHRIQPIPAGHRAPDTKGRTP